MSQAFMFIMLVCVLLPNLDLVAVTAEPVQQRLSRGAETKLQQLCKTWHIKAYIEKDLQ
jgi:hypothetical protein